MRLCKEEELEMYDFFVKFAGTFLGWLIAEFVWKQYERRKKDG